MRIVAARINHETNTFSPVPTPLGAFGPDGAPRFGPLALASARGTRTALGAFIEAADARGAAIEVAVNATANPSGKVHDAAFEALAGVTVAAAAKGCDLILLDLHGAMVTQRFSDGEAELLRRIREVAPHTPLALALDLHGNLGDEMLALADIVVGFKTYPHVDMHETGAHAARLAFRWLDGGPRPVLAWARPPLLSHTLCSATGSGAMQRAVERARALEAAGLQAVSVFAGFSLADIPEAGLSVVVVGEDAGRAQAAADELAAQVWAEREGFVYRSAALEDSLAQARAMRAAAGPGTGPVLLLDHGDNVMSGGSCDTTTLFEACLGRGMAGLGVGPIADPASVAACFSAGVGSRIRLALGNHTPLGMPGAQRPPLEVEVRVSALSDGRFRISGPIYTGETWHMGRSAAVVHTAGTLVLSERPMEPLDLGVFTSLGVEPRAFDYLLLKSRMYCRPVFGPIASGLVECDSGGVTTSDYRRFDFRHLRRPIYPLDPDTVYPGPPWRTRPTNAAGSARS